MALLNSISVPITPKTSRPAPSYSVTALTQSVRFDYAKDTLGSTRRPSPVRAPTELSSGAAELQLELRRLELEAEREERRERREEQERKERHEAEREARQHELQMKCLELGVPPPAVPAPATEGRPQASTFRVDTATKLIPKFNEHDIESFLLSFEKIAQLNGFPEDK